MPVLNVQTITQNRPAPERDKAVKILAKSIFKELKAQGYDNKQLVGFATEIISLVTSDIASDSDAR